MLGVDIARLSPRRQHRIARDTFTCLGFGYYGALEPQMIR
jgi:hypothetical protein